MKPNIWILTGLACVACCAPLLIPILSGIGAAVAGLSLGPIAGFGGLEAVCAAILAGAAVGALVLFLARREPPRCEVGGPCDPR